MEAAGWDSFRAVAGADSGGARDLSPFSRQRRREFFGPSRALPTPWPSDGELTPWVAWAPRSSGPRTSAASWGLREGVSSFRLRDSLSSLSF